MNLDFIFFKDFAILQEIRKHKWIESEKAGRDVGFATAALDWMKKYYTKWSEKNRPQPRPKTRRRELALQR